MGGVAGPCLPQIRHGMMIKKQLLSNTSLSTKAKSLVENRNKIIPICEADKQYDLVYILKEADINPDLKMSLRSVAQFCTFKNIHNDYYWEFICNVNDCKPYIEREIEKHIEIEKKREMILEFQREQQEEKPTYQDNKQAEINNRIFNNAVCCPMSAITNS